ncbi:hypothetical protein [Pseudomonas aeruginosa]|jgi:hypothetical protein|uniref:hypothetical protein n=1 Tax=Pseudomonas aeruginosa TaxID=287 RepID=UPI002D7E06F6|nr:hypothetical protein [Pseudomonas aeruginosa]HEQ2037064.1 hypothetical protein [Pseudomonas aeruginosa]
MEISDYEYKNNKIAKYTLLSMLFFVFMLIASLGALPSHSVYGLLFVVYFFNFFVLIVRLVSDEKYLSAEDVGFSILLFNTLVGFSILNLIMSFIVVGGLGYFIVFGGSLMILIAPMIVFYIFFKILIKITFKQHYLYFCEKLKDESNK